jgi:hypothetical protein
MGGLLGGEGALLASRGFSLSLVSWGKILWYPTTDDVYGLR